MKRELFDYVFKRTLEGLNDLLDLAENDQYESLGHARKELLKARRQGDRAFKQPTVIPVESRLGTEYYEWDGAAKLDLAPTGKYRIYPNMTVQDFWPAGTVHVPVPYNPSKESPGACDGAKLGPAGKDSEKLEEHRLDAIDNLVTEPYKTVSEANAAYFSRKSREIQAAREAAGRNIVTGEPLEDSDIFTDKQDGPYIVAKKPPVSEVRRIEEIANRIPLYDDGATVLLRNEVHSKRVAAPAAPLDFRGRWECANGYTADVDCYDSSEKAWLGCVDGATMWWDDKGNAFDSDRGFDLMHAERPGKKYR